MKSKQDAALAMTTAAMEAIRAVETNLVHLDEGGAAHEDARNALELLKKAHRDLLQVYMYVR